MIQQQVARSYARAFYDRIAAHVPEALQHLEYVWSYCVQYPEFVGLLNHPFIEYQKKLALITSLFEDPLHGEIQGLLALLIKRRSMSILPEIIRELRLIDLAQSSIEEVHIDSPFELTEQEKQAMVGTIQSGIHRQIAPVYHIDKTLIAGICIRIGSRVIDTSLRGQLADMRQTIMKNLESTLTTQ